MTPQADSVQRVTRAIFALKSPPPAGSEHYRAGWDDALEAAIDVVRDELTGTPENENGERIVSTYTPARPYLKTLTDAHGRTWQFAYWGSGFVYIRELIDSPDLDDLIIPIGPKASRGAWPYLIGLDDYRSDGDRGTAAWLDRRAASWIADRNNESPEATP